MQLASTSTPRSATNSATCSYDNGYRRYQRTHKMITSPGCWRPLKGLFGVIGMDFYLTSLSAPKFAMEPLAVYFTGLKPGPAVNHLTKRRNMNLRVPKSEGVRLMRPSWFLRFGTGQAGLG